MVRSALDRRFFSGRDFFANDSYIIADNGRFGVSSAESYEWNNDLLVTYNTNITDDLELSLNVGANSRIERNTGLSSNTGPGLTVPNFFALGNTQNVGSSYNVGAPRDVNSIYGFAQFAYLGAIFLDVTARNDWSSTLPSDNWSFFYPSVGLNVVLSDLTDLGSVISFAKVRASYAQVGNDTNPFQLSRTAGFECWW